MGEYTCSDCDHAFPWSPALGEPQCPRCGSRLLRTNPWLFGTPAPPAEEEYADGYFEP